MMVAPPNAMEQRGGIAYRNIVPNFSGNCKIFLEIFQNFRDFPRNPRFPTQIFFTIPWISTIINRLMIKLDDYDNKG